MAHTPGPWKWEPERELLWRDDTNLLILDIGGTCPSPADAALIAAAPVLFTACETIAGLGNLPGNDPASAINLAMAIAREAIATAKPND